MTAFSRRARTAACFVSLLLAYCGPLRADRAADVRGPVAYVASALSSGNPSDALGPFDRSFKNYGKLNDYFSGLTRVFEVTSEIEVKDEEDGDADTKLLVTWSLTLTDPISKATIRRISDVNLTLAVKSGKWRIVDISPIELFNPQQARS